MDEVEIIGDIIKLWFGHDHNIEDMIKILSNDYNVATNTDGSSTVEPV